MYRSLSLPALAAVALLGLPAAAHAQVFSFCGGDIQAQFFAQAGTARTTYSTTLTNVSGTAKAFQIVVLAPLLDRPAGGSRSLAPGGMTTIGLGYEPAQAGRIPMRPNLIAQNVRVTCL